MYIDLVGIGNQKNEYVHPDTCHFEANHKTYWTIAKKIISYFAPRYGSGLAKEMLASEDAISNIATQIMLADWRWDKNYKNKKGTVRTLNAYRNQCGDWAIRGYLTRKARHQASPVYAPVSLNSLNEDGNEVFASSLADESCPAPEESIEQIEEVQENKNAVHKLLTSGVLTDQQESFIRAHYLEQKSKADIARENNISRQAVEYSIGRGILKMRELVNGEV